MNELFLEHVGRRFGSKTAVRDLSFYAHAGEILGFIGPNGAGKSTTMRMIGGDLAPTSGRIFICSHDVNEAPLQAKRFLGYLPENAPTYAGMSVKSFLKYIGALRGMRARQLRDRIAHVAEECRIQDVLAQSVDTLSKGYRHRVCLAQALLHDPKVLILDEPTDGLDPNQKFETRQLIRRLADTGKTIVLSTHILEEVQFVCDRALVIADGEKRYEGPVQDLLVGDSNRSLQNTFRRLTTGVR